MKTSVMIGTTYSSENNGYPVYYRINDCRNKRILIASGLYTFYRFSGTDFPNNEPNAKEKTEMLRKGLARVEKFCRMNPCMYGEELKGKVMVYIGRKAGERRKSMLLVDIIVEYMNKEKDMKPATRKIYSLTARRVGEYDKSVRITDIDLKWLNGFDKFLRDDGKSINSIAQRMRNIKTILNYSRDMGYPCMYPFGGHRGYKIREEFTVPYSLTAEQFAMIRDYPVEPWMEKYRDLFCLSFYLGGINGGDLLLCKGLKNGRLVFVRRKTDKSNARTIHHVSLPVYPEAMEIINKYKGKDYLLDVMDNMSDYKTFEQHWNKALKKIGPSKMVKNKIGVRNKIHYEPLFPNLKALTARYTFASIASNECDLSDRTIGKCMGHSWASKDEVTSRYISHDQKKVDRAIRMVIDHVNSFKG